MMIQKSKMSPSFTSSRGSLEALVHCLCISSETDMHTIMSNKLLSTRTAAKHILET